MPGLNWRSEKDYPDPNTITIGGLAWEYLRRDPNYQRDFERLRRITSPTATVLDAFTHRWGMRFRA